MARGRGGKFTKPKCGGGKHFSKDLRPLDAEGAEKSMWASGDEEDEEGEEGEEGSEEDSDEDDSASEEEANEDNAVEAARAKLAKSNIGSSSSALIQPEMTREERKKLQKAKKLAAIKKKNAPQVGDLPSSSESEEEDEDMPANPNHTAKARQMASQPVTQASESEEEEASDDAAAGKGKQPAASKSAATSRKSSVANVQPGQLSRREREALQAQQAKERYQKLHAEGKTDEAKSDLARLKLVREARDAAKATKAAEDAEKQALFDEKKAYMEKMEREKEKAARTAALRNKSKKKAS